MKRIRFHEVGGPEKLILEDASCPTPAEDQVRVKIHAAGVNFIDIYQRSGLYKKPLPWTPGLEGTGVVLETGSGVREFSVGDRVAWADAPGSYAEEAVLPARRLVPLPPGIGFELGAAGLFQGLTAHYLGTSTFDLRPGTRCLIHAAAGGVGQLLCQIAKRRGAFVIGTVSTPEKAELAKAAGADEVILYSEQDFEQETRRITAGEGVDVVYDSVGRDTWRQSLGCLRSRGLLAMFGQSSGAVPPVDLLYLMDSGKGSPFLTRASLFHYIAERPELLSRAAEVFQWIEAGDLQIRVAGRYPLAEAARAHEALASRRTSGKLILLP